jgi:hypothetical protein
MAFNEKDRGGLNMFDCMHYELIDFPTRWSGQNLDKDYLKTIILEVICLYDLCMPFLVCWRLTMT